ncbi:MAG: hypothetical protein AB7S94_11075 [Simkaniaceae bacterium]
MAHGGKASRIRYREKKRAEAILAINTLKQAGKNCGICSHYEKGECSLHSDFSGVVKTGINSVCLDWKEGTK